MKKIVKTSLGCVSLLVILTKVGTTENEIYAEVPISRVGVKYTPKNTFLVKSPLAPRYHKGYELWKLFPKNEDGFSDSQGMNEESWQMGEAKL